jgi:hypothetical protein
MCEEMDALYRAYLEERARKLKGERSKPSPPNATDPATAQDERNAVQSKAAE